MTTSPRRRLALIVLLVCLAAAWPRAADAQWVVHDPINFWELYVQRLQQLQQLEHWRKQAQRLAQSKLVRYRTPPVPWRIHDVEAAFPYARDVLAALNYGDGQGAAYLRTVDTLRSATVALARLPFDQRRRATAQLADIELADSAAQMAIHQIGTIRYNGRSALQAINDLETDTLSPFDDDQTQVAVLNKINAGSVLELRAQQHTNQLLVHLVEQLLADAKRQRDAEVQHLNSRLLVAEDGESFYRQVFGGVARQLTAGRP
jgi:hypothetical protein